MNKMLFASIAAVATALMGSPIRAEAGHHHHGHDDDDDEIVAAIGGFIGGVIVGSAINNTSQPAPLPPPAIGASVSYGQTRSFGHGHHHGHWSWTTVRVWVPGRWAYVDRDCARPRRVWMDGYYDTRRQKVWVAHRGGNRCDRGCR